MENAGFGGTKPAQCPDCRRPRLAYHGGVTSPLTGSFLTPQGFVHGRLQISPAGRIATLTGQACSEAEARAGTHGPLWLPGFVDLHVHGGGGHDTMAGADAVAHIARLHARHGTTALLATTMTATPEDLRTALRGLRAAIDQRPAQGAMVLGVHLEGPYIHPARLGAQPDAARPLSLDELTALHALAPIRLITLAPELPGHLAQIPALTAAGFRVQIGHSNGCYEDGVAALAAGACGFTHLFNAMSPFHHRAPGMVGAALAHAQRAELIPDLLHVHPGAIRAALRAIPGLYCVTDSTAAAGMPDGEYWLGSRRVTKCLGGVRLPDGTLAGSTLTMDQALRNLLGLGLDLSDASARCSRLAADHLGLAEHGRLVPGAWANLVQLDSACEVQAVWVQGHRLH